MNDSVSNEKTFAIAAINQQQTGLHVTFSWNQDRFGHVISVVDQDQLIPVFVSVEHGKDSSWPNSPPLQDASVEQRGEKELAFLVGQAGDAHWSVAAEADPESTAVIFDVACRMKEHPAELCSRYATLVEELAEPTFDLENRWNYQVLDHQIQVERILYDQYPPTEMPADAKSFSIEASVDHLPFPKTIQWKYRIALM